MTAEPLTLTDVDAAFHAERRTGIGGGDVAALVGLSRYGSPYSVWARLVGLLHPTPETPRQTIGHELEPVIAAYRDRRPADRFDDLDPNPGRSLSTQVP